MQGNYKNIIILIFAAIYTMNLFGQEEDYGVIFWTKERDLDWNDFKGKSLIDSTENFYMDLYIQSANINEMETFILYGTKPEAYLYSNTSYVHENLQNEDLLRYLNAYWDLAGYYAYKLTKGMSAARKSDNMTLRSNPEILRNSIIEEWRIESNRLSIETEYGMIIEKLLMWEDDIAAKVDMIQKAKLEISDYSFGVDLGVGGRIASSQYSEYLTKGANAVFGLEFSKSPITYALTISIGDQTVLKTITDGDDIFPEDSDPSFITLFTNAGYKIIDNNSLRITPRAGIHFSQLRYPEDSDLESIKWAINIGAGISADIKLIKWTAPSYQSQAMSDLSLRISTYYFPMSLGDANLSYGVISAGLSWTIGGGHLSW